MFERIESDLKVALKERDSLKVQTLRLLLAEVKNETIKNRRSLDDSEIIKVIQKQIGRRQESAGLYRKGGRTELAEKEEAEMIILKAYLPPQLPDGEIEKIVDQAIQETGAESRKDIGKVMEKVSFEIEGRADRGKVARMVADRLSI